MFLELESNNMFKAKYFELLKYRLASCSIELEENNIEVNDPKHSIEIFNQLEAINYIFDNGKKKLNHIDFTNLLCGVVSRITNNEIDNFRNVKIMVNGSKVNRTKPEMIRNDLWYLIDDYNYLIERCKTEEEILEVEAQFHIRLLHIHPFEDANGRTSRIFLLYNMCKNNIAPFVIRPVRKGFC